jgi:hypothetical protein
MLHACASLTKFRGGGPICNGGNETVEAADLLVQTTLSPRILRRHESAIWVSPADPVEGKQKRPFRA